MSSYRKNAQTFCNKTLFGPTVPPLITWTDLYARILFLLSFGDYGDALAPHCWFTHLHAGLRLIPPFSDTLVTGPRDIASSLCSLNDFDVTVPRHRLCIVLSAQYIGFRLHLNWRSSASGSQSLRGYFYVHSRYDLDSCSCRLAALCLWASKGNVSITPCHSSYRASCFCRDGPRTR